MMQNYLTWIKSIWLLFVGDGTIVITSCIVMLFFLLWPRNFKLKQYFLYPSIVILIFINNPLCIYYIVESGLLSYNRYVRLYWLLPVTFILAYLCVKLVTKAKNWRRIVVALICAGIIIYTGSYMFTNESYTKMTNLYKLPDDVIEICDFIENDVIFGGKTMEETRIVAPVIVSSYIHQYNGEIKTLFGRYNNSSVYYDVAQNMMKLLEAPELDVKAICDYAHESACDYIVIDDNKPQNGKFRKYDYEQLAQVESYIIYKEVAD